MGTIPKIFYCGLAIALLASACDEVPSISKAALASRATRPATQGPLVQGPVGNGGRGENPAPARAIDTFAQSLESLTFIYDRADHRARISFTNRLPEGLQPVGEFTGEVAPSRKAELQGPPDRTEFRVTLECTDEACRSSTLVIDKLSGTLAGQ